MDISEIVSMLEYHSNTSALAIHNCFKYFNRLDNSMYKLLKQLFPLINEIYVRSVYHSSRMYYEKHLDIDYVLSTIHTLDDLLVRYHDLLDYYTDYRHSEVFDNLYSAFRWSSDVLNLLIIYYDKIHGIDVEW